MQILVTVLFWFVQSKSMQLPAAGLFSEIENLMFQAAVMPYF